MGLSPAPGRQPEDADAVRAAAVETASRSIWVGQQVVNHEALQGQPQGRPQRCIGWLPAALRKRLEQCVFIPWPHLEQTQDGRRKIVQLEKGA